MLRISLIPPSVGCKLKKVLYLTDLLPSSTIGFVHALKIALVCQTELDILHFTKHRRGATWEDFPSIRSLLVKWGQLPPGSSKNDILDLGLNISKIISHKRNLVYASLDYAQKHHPDLMVIGGKQVNSYLNWLHGSKSRFEYYKLPEMALLLPEASKGFVDISNGNVNLYQILIPVIETTQSQLAINRVATLARFLGINQLKCYLLHVGTVESMPEIIIPNMAKNWTWESIICQGDIETQIISYRERIKPDLLVMTTNTHQNLFKVWHSGITQTMMNNISCSVLAISSH